MDSEVEPDFYDSGTPSLKDTSSLFSWTNLYTCSSSLCYSEPSEEVAFSMSGDYLMRLGYNSVEETGINCYYFRPES